MLYIKPLELICKYSITMIEKQTAGHSLGIHFSSRSVQCAQVILSQGKPKIEAVATIPLESDDVKPLYMKDSTPVVFLTQQWLTVTGLKGTEVLTRSLDLKLKKEKDIEAVLSFQAEPVIPYPVEDTVLEFSLLSTSKKGSQIVLYSTKKETLSQHIAHMQEYGIEPEVITCAPAALAIFGYYFSTTPNSTWPLYIIHVGENETTCVLTQEGKVLASHAIRLGAPLHDEYEILRLEIGKTLYALAKQSKIDNVTEILLCGPGAHFKDFALHLSKSLNTSITMPKSHPDLIEYALPIGYALSGLSHVITQVNFRTGDFSYPHPWKRFKKPLLSYIALCLGLSLIFLLFTSTWVVYKERHIQEKYSDLLISLDKPYSAFEREFLSKTRNIPDTHDIPITHITELSQRDLQERINYLEKEVRATPDIFPLLPNVPRVSDVLAWLSTHPQVTPHLNIESFSYTLVKRPDQKKKNEKYQIKVELEFLTPTPKLAREFHDALIEPNDLVDPKGEVKWSSSKDKYRTSFFLKNKTVGRS